MFKKFYQLFKPRNNNSEPKKNTAKSSIPERVTFSCVFFKIELIAPSWKAVLLATIILITVVVIIYGLRGSLLQLKDTSTCKKDPFIKRIS
jgi:hypothetical protein